ncbi:hypothetical protein EO95_13940 [Methanosarcina sp. 1.H.T.1A.1]|uniref:glycosyltransferase family 4 protein n=1 Tax=Methanosarcina sp. 1.H.T.1A.1 TaxID=1483602 RepID=UPI0006219BED|nr:glycosyltransferase family 4 protein [Methanosarcina sp. 1.H.T.1A.1]KKI00372.1 hypothetical protein EO95_13940 [Methanosarcina sp. 1.H.T.1A.1]
MGESQNKLHICHICTKYPPAVSGIAKHVYDLSQLQAKQGHYVTIYCPNDVGDISSIDIHPNVHVIPLRSLGRPLNNPITPSIFIELMKSDFDIVHAHDFFLFGTIIAGFMNRIKKYPLIITCHTNKLIYNSKIKSVFQDLYISTIGIFILRGARKVVVHNAENKRIFSEFGLNNLEIVPNGIYPQDYMVDVRDIIHFKEKLGLKENERILLFVGRLVDRKGILDLIKAYAIINKSCPDTKLIIVGDGPLKNSLKKIVSDSKLEQNVIFMGFVSFYELVLCYHIADLTVVPSIFGETQGIVTLESLICGTPLVVSDLPCFTQMLPKENICVFSSENFEQLAEKIIGLFQDDLSLKKLMEGCKEFVVFNYSWEIISKKMDQLYNSI